MGEHEVHDLPEVVAGLPQVVVVEVAVVCDPGARSFLARITSQARDTRWCVIAMFGLVLAIAVGGTLWLTNRDASPLLVNVVAPERGPTGLGPAYGSPPDCLSVTSLTIGGTRSQGDVNHQTRCGHDTGYPTPIFQYISGAWRPVLDALRYVCSVASLPARTHAAFDGCLPTRADRLALER